jgi:predicted ATPase/class 3 adenylate cyclase
MTQPSDEIAKVKAALAEVLAKRSAFSAETYTQIVLVLYDRLRHLQTVSQSSEESAPVVAKSDEIRLVTVMFIDVVDSTEIARRLDAEGRTDDWKAIIGSAHARLAGVIDQWDGEVGQYLGDGLLCFFGASRSRGDDAIRCVSCALTVQEAMRQYAAEISTTIINLNMDFAVRIGISTGRVVVGRIGTEKKNEVLAVGPTTNLAARLQSLCAPGGILIDAETYYRVHDRFIVQALPPVKVKGFDTPIEHYAVPTQRQPLPAQFMSNMLAGIPIPFVGREAELDQIQSILDRSVADQQFAVITLYGEVGIGKSRLQQEVLLKTPMSFRQLCMAARYEKRAVSYNLLRNLLAIYCNLTDDTPAALAEPRIFQYVNDTWPHPDAEATAAVLGYLAGYGFADHPAVQPIKSEGGESEAMAFSWLGKWFEGLAETGPLLLTVDNLQWADNGSLRMLEHLARVLAERSGVLLMTARPEFGYYFGRGFQQHTEITLAHLSEGATKKLIEAVLRHVSGLPEVLLPLISTRAQGNPLFVEEFLRMLFDNGVFEPAEGGGWRVNNFLYRTMASALPNGLMGVLQARLDDLDERARRVVQIAAVIGQTFWGGCVSFLARFDAQAILSDLVARGLIEQNLESSLEGEDEFAFRHTLYREVAYEILTRANREVYHQQAADWLMKRVANRPEYLGVLADHLARGKQREHALAMYVAAANDRMQRGLLSETLKLIESGLAAAREVPREIALPLVSKLWLQQGQTLVALNRYQEASAASHTAMMLLEEMPVEDMLEERVIAAQTLGDVHRKLGQYQEAYEALLMAYGLLPDENTGQLASILRAFGALARYQGQLDEGLTYHQQAIELAQGSSQRLIASNMTALGLIALDRGELASALGYFEQVLELNQQSSNVYYQIMDLNNVGMVYSAVFAYHKALEIFNQAEVLQASIHYHNPLLETNRGLCLIALGQADEGLTLFQQAADLPQQNAFTRQLIRLLTLAGLALSGKYEDCREKAATFVADIRETNPILYGRGLLWQGLAQHALGNAAASTTLREALDTELKVAGRDAWLCYYALGRASDDPTFAADCFSKASDILKALANSLQMRPELQATFINNDFVQAVLAAGYQTESE